MRIHFEPKNCLTLLWVRWPPRCLDQIHALMVPSVASEQKTCLSRYLRDCSVQSDKYFAMVYYQYVLYMLSCWMTATITVLSSSVRKKDPFIS